MKKRIFALFLTVIVIFTVNGMNVSFTDDQTINEQNEEIEHLIKLGIITGNEDGEINSEEPITKEQFAKIIVNIAKLDDEVKHMKDTTIFPDVSSDRWSNGYINVVVEKGYLNGNLDGQFHPNDSLTYAEVCTALVKVFGYQNNEITGTWPKNYVLKAGEIGITDGISLSVNDKVSRRDVAIMVYNLLNTVSRSNPNITFAQMKELYTECVILETNKTSDLITEYEVLTDKGSFYISDDETKVEAGNKYRIKVKDDAIVKIYQDLSSVTNISVEKASRNNITYTLEEDILSMALSSKTVYYYKGKVMNYDDISEILQVNTSIVLNKNDNGIGYEYGVIYDPIYSEPQIVNNFNISNKRIGEIEFEQDTKITRNGELIAIEDIVENDVVYQISDIWENNKYIIVIDDKVEGEITDILPNKISPKFIEIAGVKYEISEDMNYNKISNSKDFEVNDNAIVLIGNDRKVVDIVIDSDSDNENFALVLNYYTEISVSEENFGEELTFAKLLHVDGTTETYEVKKDEDSDDEEDEEDNQYKGKMIIFNVLDSEEEEANEEFTTIEIEELEHLQPQEHIIDKVERKIDSNYFADNIKIFNIIHNDDEKDSVAYVMDWEDLPNGIIQSDKIKYINKVGEFEDINVMLADDILDEKTYLALVTKTRKVYNESQFTGYTQTVLINGKKYINNEHIEVLSEGNVFDVDLLNDEIISSDSVWFRTIETTKVQGIDSTRIKVENEIYKFSDNVVIYFKDHDDVYKLKGIDDISIEKEYESVKVYLNNSKRYNGKAEIIVVSE